MKDICIYVANHKDADSLDGNPYRLLRVGSTAEMALGGAEGFLEDDASDGAQKEIVCDSFGDSIAYKNFAYCELTGLYWIWKNSCHDITGLMHYRRYLASPVTGDALSAEEVEQLLERHDILVPRPVSLNCSVAEHYCFCHISYDLLALTKVIERQPERYRLAFSKVMESDVMVPCNIMVAGKRLFDAYCEWLFSVLDECESVIALYAGRDSYQRRVFGFLAERLLMVWLVANDVDCGFCDVMAMGDAEVLHDSVRGDYAFNFAAGIDGIDHDLLFDDSFYRDTYEDVAQAYPAGSAIDHYLEYGFMEGRAATPTYSLLDYANMRPKLRARLGNAPAKFLKSLSKETRRKKVTLSRHIALGLTRDGLTDYAPVYDWAFYASKYDDVPGDYFDTRPALRHFIEVGMPEGRQGSKEFSLDAYKEKHPELVERFGDDNKRYFLRYLRGEGRRRRPINWKYAL